MSLRLAFIGILLVAARLPAQSPRAAHPTRCFALHFGKWMIGDEPLHQHRPLPAQIALTDSAVSRSDHSRTAEFWAARLPQVGEDSLRTEWWRERGDTIGVRLPAWWSTGIMLRFASNARRTVGRAQVYVDYAPSKPTWARVTVQRVACPDTVRIPGAS